MNVIPEGVVILLLASSFASFAKEQRLTYDQDVSVYELIFDDTRISLVQMREAAWLSPYVSAAYGTAFPAPFELAGSETKSPDGTLDLDKVFLAPWLELCTAVPPAKCAPYDPLIPNAAFLRNAAKNLKRGDDQIDRLRRESLPAALEPVRAYLLQHLKRSVERQRYRYGYLKSGDAIPMGQLLCRECTCGASEESMLAQLKTVSDPKAKLELSTKWDQRLFECERKRHPPAYPLAAWERFLKDFGITERRRFKHID
jgi:hypothetical protein